MQINNVCCEKSLTIAAGERRHAQEGEAEMLSSYNSWLFLLTINLHRERFAIFGDDVFCCKKKEKKKASGNVHSKIHYY